MTPMMQQYLEIKERNKDSLLFYRLGDFYELFFEDAKVASRELDLVLTGRDCGEEERAPMCGVPYHAVEGYIAKLIAKGYRIAVCEQLEDPAVAKGIVKRDIVRVISPGTVTENSCLSEDKNNFLAAIFAGEKAFGIAFADISTGEIYARELEKNEYAELYSELSSYSPRETLCQSGVPGAVADFLSDKLGSLITRGGEFFDTAENLAAVKKQLGADFVKKYEVTEDSPAVVAVGALLRFVESTQKVDTGYIKKVEFYAGTAVLKLDLFTRRSLELTESMRNKEKKDSLLGVLDRTKTAAGARLLRKWIERPLVNCKQIGLRQDAVEALFGNTIVRENIIDELKQVTDIERLLTRLVYGTGSARDIKSLGLTLAKIPYIKSQLGEFSQHGLKTLNDSLESFEELSAKIERVIVDNPPFSIREGGMINRGVSPELDRLIDVAENSLVLLKEFEERERASTGIKTLKVGYNRVFGYYIEISKGSAAQAPEHYIRRQTLTNGERYIIPELKTLENEVLTASEKRKELEGQIFESLREEILDGLTRLQSTASALAALDVYTTLAAVAVRNNYVRPEVDYSDVISIKEGRHPVVEKNAGDFYFVPNDAELDCRSNMLMLITGPNMAGKSTYMRQVAVITVMAQIGSFVPAKEARIGVTDRIYTRVGASDDLASGQSTFMVEMVEVAAILSGSTNRSLIIYDEIGRGTATYDGMSIARAVIEYTVKKIGAKTLFATHYHELTVLEDELPGVVNYSIAAKKRGEEIVFLRKIIKGGADESYGIEVAALAGVPKQVVKRAKEILASHGKSEAAPTVSKKTEEGLDDSFRLEDLRVKNATQKLKNLDINTLTPFEALAFLYELKKEIGS